MRNMRKRKPVRFGNPKTIFANFRIMCKFFIKFNIYYFCKLNKLSIHISFFVIKNLYTKLLRKNLTDSSCPPSGMHTAWSAVQIQVRTIGNESTPLDPMGFPLVMGGFLDMVFPVSTSSMRADFLNTFYLQYC